MKQIDLLNVLDVKTCTLDLYLCRAEFAHIKKKKFRNEWIYQNISINDLKKLKKLTSRHQNRKRNYLLYGD